MKGHKLLITIEKKQYNWLKLKSYGNKKPIVQIIRDAIDKVKKQEGR